MTEADHPPAAFGGVLETVLYSRDLGAAELFYRETLGLTLLSRKEGVFLFFRMGDGMLLIFNPDRSREDRGVPKHGTEGSGHICFAAPQDRLDQWEAHLIEHGVQIEHRHDWPRGGRSFYFRDPADNSLEIATPLIWGLKE